MSSAFLKVVQRSSVHTNASQFFCFSMLNARVCWCERPSVSCELKHADNDTMLPFNQSAKTSVGTRQNSNKRAQNTHTLDSAIRFTSQLQKQVPKTKAKGGLKPHTQQICLVNRNLALATKRLSKPDRSVLTSINTHKLIHTLMSEPFIVIIESSNRQHIGMHTHTETMPRLMTLFCS